MLLAFLLLGAVSLFVENSRVEQRGQSDPRRCRAGTVSSRRLVKAVVWQESRFQSFVRGRAQELGLMQIREEARRNWPMPSTSNGFEHATVWIPIQIRSQARGL